MACHNIEKMIKTNIKKDTIVTNAVVLQCSKMPKAGTVKF